MRQKIPLLQSNTIYCLSNTHNNKPGLHFLGIFHEVVGLYPIF